ncbi:plexin domain-containing protein 2-like [Oppia nitens]|uniref:plexin domain-containing protein 2-like n=1 Tax=Oppia nitens TaxID=1686743 RepID=UPI0023DCC1BA|nr:plexin domain-containing protein 2-like [Oppia nitens]
MANTATNLLIITLINYYLICQTNTSNVLDFWEFSDNELNSNLKYHTIVRRNSDDLDIKLKKTSPTKKPTIVAKLDVTQKNISTKQTITNNNTNNNKTTVKETVILPNITVTYVDVDDDNNTNITTSTELPETQKWNETQYENHTYYSSTFYPESQNAMHLWVNISTFPRHQTVVHDMLSNSHRRAATVTLPFEFNFYGHRLTNVTIATGGFLYLGDHVHSWLAATQYIAAIMANFDTSLSNSSTIQYAYNETAFVVQWEDVMLHDRNPDGLFSFQIILFKNGDIAFVYKSVPVVIKDLSDSKHPVKVGISDAYIIDRTIFFIRRKTIYEYHRVDLKDYAISNNTAIYFKALPTCASLQTCGDCVSAAIGFHCGWCDSINRCSDGYDRHRQEWIVKNCESAIKEGTVSCAPNTTATSLLSNMTTHPFSRQTIISSDDNNKIDMHDGSLNSKTDYLSDTSPAPSSSSSSSAGLVSVLVILAFFSGISLWVFYAYKNPQSSSGQMLIRYRPSQWRWASSEARYTAASIHM